MPIKGLPVWSVSQKQAASQGRRTLCMVSLRLVFLEHVCAGGGGANVTFHGIYMVPAEILYHCISVYTSGPHWNVACSVAKVISCRLFAGRWTRPLGRASLITQSVRRSHVVQM